MEKLVYVNPHKEDNCEITELNQNWKTMLSTYMTTHYIAVNSYEVHNHYFIAIDSISNDTINMLNRANVTVYTIDRIIGCTLIKFRDEKSRDLVFDILKEKVV